MLSWFWNKIYDGIKVNNIEGVQKVAQGYEVIYVPCHRSHIDYLLLSYLLFKNGLTPPHIAAGINLNMPVIGSLLRRGGAFFMRRTFKGNPLYTSVFNEYLHLVHQGLPGGVLRRRRPFAHRAHAATKDRNAGDHPAQLLAFFAHAHRICAGLHRL